MKTHLAKSAAILATVVMLAGCAAESSTPPNETGSPSAVSEEVTAGVPTGWEDLVDNDKLGQQILTGWVEEGKSFAVVTWGSSTCVPVADSLEVTADDAMTLSFTKSPNEVCTMDMAPATHTIAVPGGVTKRPITLTVKLPDTSQSDISVLK